MLQTAAKQLSRINGREKSKIELQKLSSNHQTTQVQVTVNVEGKKKKTPQNWAFLRSPVYQKSFGLHDFNIFNSFWGFPALSSPSQMPCKYVWFRPASKYVPCVSDKAGNALGSKDTMNMNKMDRVVSSRNSSLVEKAGNEHKHTYVKIKWVIIR